MFEHVAVALKHQARKLANVVRYPIDLDIVMNLSNRPCFFRLTQTQHSIDWQHERAPQIDVTIG